MLASTVGLEQAGGQEYQTDHMGKIFSQGFSFSGFERDKLYVSDGGQRFVDISGLSGLDSVTDGRGAAYADFDNDGDYDIFLTALQGQVHHLFRNNVGQDGGFIRVELQGTASGRDAYGAEVRIITSHGVQTKVKAGGSGYVSQSDPRLLFGLGGDERTGALEVRWPSGRIESLARIPAGASVRIVEGSGAYQEVDEARFALPDPAGDEALFFQALRYQPGDLFPAVAMSDDSGATTDFQAYRRPGRSYLINFWATYCVPCREEMPELQKLAADLEAAGVDLLGISLDMGTARKKVPRFLSRMGIDYPVFTTEEGVFQQLFAGEQFFIPLSYIVDGDGRIVDVLTGWSPRAQRLIHQLIGGGSGVP